MVSELFTEEEEKMFEELYKSGRLHGTCRPDPSAPGKVICTARIFDEEKKIYEEGDVAIDIVEKPNGEIDIRPLPGGGENLQPVRAQKAALWIFFKFYGGAKELRRLKS